VNEIDNINDDDLLLLETYLDGELSEDEAQAVVRRMNEDAAFSAVFQRLSSERHLRQDCFRVMEREEISASATMSSADRVSRSIHQAATRELVWSTRLRVIRQVSALAACLVVGVGVGWIANSSRAPLRPQNPSSVTDRTNVVPVDYDQQPGFKVAITDNQGRVLAEQHFNTLSEAREFSNDIARYQARQRQARNGEIRLIGGGF
jgi:anti-sigma-K factor RskA